MKKKINLLSTKNKIYSSLELNEVLQRNNKKKSKQRNIISGWMSTETNNELFVHGFGVF